MQIGDLQKLGFEKKSSIVEDINFDSTESRRLTDVISGIVGNFSEIEGDVVYQTDDILPSLDNNYQQPGITNGSTNPLEDIFKMSDDISDPDLQEFYNQQIIDASESIRIREEYLLNRGNKGSESDQDLVETSLG